MRTMYLRVEIPDDGDADAVLAAMDDVPAEIWRIDTAASPLNNPDERARAAKLLRMHALDRPWQEDEIRALADKLEAEPEPAPPGADVPGVAGTSSVDADGVALIWVCTKCGGRLHRRGSHCYGPAQRPHEPVQAAAVRVVPERERDEALEALRELLEAASALVFDRDDGLDPLVANAVMAVKRSRAVLERVERTHALVPVRAAAWAAELAEEVADEQGLTAPDSPLMRMSAAFAAAARGEGPVWPS